MRLILNCFSGFSERLKPELREAIKFVPHLLICAIALGSAANVALPSRIDWVYDWSNHIEGRAYAENFPVATFEAMRDIVATGEEIIIDARRTELYMQGHIPGALQLSPCKFNDVFGTLALLNSRDRLIVYCGDAFCEDALNVARLLRAGGFSDVGLYIGGWEEWKRLGEIE